MKYPAIDTRGLIPIVREFSCRQSRDRWIVVDPSTRRLMTDAERNRYRRHGTVSYLRYYSDLSDGDRPAVMIG